MTTPLTSTRQTSGVHCPQPVENTNKNPIENGVNSHAIQFELETVAKKVQTVVGASLGENRRVDYAIENLKPRLLKVYEKGSCLISFGSSNSLDRIKNCHNQPLKANSSSLLEQILIEAKKYQLDGIQLTDTVKFKSVTGCAQTDHNGLNYLSGTIKFQITGEPDREIEFREICPDYDGWKLDSATLLAALQHLPENEASNSSTADKATNTTHPHFYSANGIGRSASLAVLYSFREMCVQQNGFPPGDVKRHLDTLIEQGRAQRNKHFVNTGEQENELLTACHQINEVINNTNKTTERANQTSVDTPVPPAPPVAAASQPPKAAAASTPKPAPTAVPKSRPAPVTAPAPAPASAPAPAPAPATIPASRSVAAPVNAPKFTTPQTVRGVSETVIKLATDQPIFGRVSDRFPYMPINLDGITKLARKDEFQLPALTAGEAKNFATDIYKAGFHGDALGAECETLIYSRRKALLIKKMSDENREKFNDEATTIETRDGLLIYQLKQVNHIPKHPQAPREFKLHEATDDTQQGALSALAKMGWIKNGNGDLNELAEKTLASFRTPAFPGHPQNITGTFEIRGPASTLRMCQDETREKYQWHDVAIYDVDEKTGMVCRAGGAGNGGMMRIGYDLLPLLASRATTQDLVEQVLISNQVTHPSSLSAVACVGQVMLMVKCINWRLNAKSRPNQKLPNNFFIDTYYEVAKELQHKTQKFTPQPEYSFVPEHLEDEFDLKQWRAPRFPSEFLKASENSSKAIKAGSVEQALVDAKTQKRGSSSAEIDSVLKRWSSNSYLGATFPTVVFLLEKFGYDNPALAVNMAALVTKDSDTCATIIAQVMGALHGSRWVNTEHVSCKDSSGKSTFSQDLGGGFKLTHLIDHTTGFYYKHEAQQKTQHTN